MKCRATGLDASLSFLSTSRRCLGKKAFLATNGSVSLRYFLRVSRMPLERQPAWLVGADNQNLNPGSGVTGDLDLLIQAIILFCNGKFLERGHQSRSTFKREIYISPLLSSEAAFYSISFWVCRIICS